MKLAGLVLTGLLVIVLAASGTLCPPGSDNCASGLLHALFLVTVGVALSIPLIPQAHLRPARLIAYESYCPDPAAPPPRG